MYAFTNFFFNTIFIHKRLFVYPTSLLLVAINFLPLNKLSCKSLQRNMDTQLRAQMVLNEFATFLLH